MNLCDAQTTIEVYADVKTAELLGAVCAAMHDAANDPSEEPVHDMRVAIRRLQQGLRTFGQYYPRKGVKRIRSDMKRVMDCAGEVRNFDIAMILAKRRGVRLPELAERREAALVHFRTVLAEVAVPGLEARWRKRLALSREA